MFAPRTKLHRHTPPVLSSTFFGWIPQLLRIPEAEVLDCVGLDAVMLLRFHSMAAKLFFCCAIPGFLIILPINKFLSKHGYSPDSPGNSRGNLSALDTVDEPKGTSIYYLLCQFAFTWTFSILTIYTIWNTYEGYVSIRRKYMQRRAKSIVNRSVMVVGLPDILQNDRGLAIFYESLGLGTVESAHVCRHVAKLKELVEQRAQALKKLEEAYTEYYGNPSGVPNYDPDKIMAGDDRPQTIAEQSEHASDSTSLLRPRDKKEQIKERPTMRLGFLGLFGKKVDKIDHRKEVFAALDERVQNMRLRRIFTTTGVGFITFEEMYSAQIFAQTVNTHETLSCQTVLAPEPRDIIWDNLNLPPNELGIRTVVVNTIIFFMIFFWSGPIGLLSSLLNLDSLEKWFPGATKLAMANPIFKSLLQGFLPSIGLELLLAVVPMILEVLCKNQGLQSYSGIGRSLYNKYFTFILVNVVLVLTIAGTWVQTANKVYHNLGELALLLAISLPRVSPFFVNYIILKGIGRLPLRLLQLVDVILQSFKGILSKTPRDYAEARAPPQLQQGEVYADSTLAFVIVLIYSCIKPLILGFGVAYFALGYVVYKYQLLYVFFHPYESNGQSWPMVYNRIMVGLLLFQSTMLGLFLLKKSFLLGGLLVPLLIGTIWFWIYTTKKYKRSAQFLPLELMRPSAIQAEIESYRTYLLQENPAAASENVAIQIDESSGMPVRRRSSRALRHIPKSAVEDDDYQAIPDRNTDYRQPPMTIFPGILNSNLRHYNNPAIAGPLPTLWLPLKKGSGGKTASLDDDDDLRVGTQYPDSGSSSDSDSDSDDGHNIESALSGQPFMLPTLPSDEPQNPEEADNLVGGGQDDDLSTPAPTATGSSSRTPAATEAGVTGEEDSARDAAVEGVDDVYYHHPPKSNAPSGRPRKVQGQQSHGILNFIRKKTPSGDAGSRA
ncbi:hypothetical protein BGZ65_002034 [Modicella reniformis]|uniref:DUF221-domain-containing protein n=1 Tax=Modicella reniformis TaxID=1440133 RepID=A0A9P6M333_9FUNG|nr:hypothetical protein BGZ65_002034 [Modicella reniformis]